MPSQPIAAFEIHRTIEDQEREENAGKSRFRPFHHVRRVATVAAMLRHSVDDFAESLGWKTSQRQSVVHGHGEAEGEVAKSDERLHYLPLPSLTPVGVRGIRRILLMGPPGFDLAPLRRRLNGKELIDKDTQQPVAMLSSIPITDPNLKRYLDSASTWSTVTPVILPGYDDPTGLRRKLRDRSNAEEQKHLLARLESRILALTWKAFE